LCFQRYRNTDEAEIINVAAELGEEIGSPRPQVRTDEDCLAGDDLGDREACLEVVARGPRPSGLELALLVGL
jgi:hypothetical protein